MGFHVYGNNREPVTGEVQKTCMEPQNKVDKYAVAVVVNENNVIGHKREKQKIRENNIYFLKTDPLNICPLIKLQERLQTWETTKG